jgi:acetyltransferase
MPLVGRIAFISQSGALCTAILDWSLSANIGFSHFVSIGNAVDVDFADLIDYLADDPDTTSIVLYVESIAKAAEFLSAARAFTRTKPIVAYKAGRFAASAQAAASHTGAMAGIDEVYDAAFRRAGVVRVEEAEDMFDCAELLATHRLPGGPRLAIVTNSGGPGVMAADELLKKRGQLAQLALKTIERLNAELPPHWSHANPVDVLGDAGADRFARAVEIVLEDANTDALLAIVAPQAITDPTDMAKETARIAATASKPMLAAWMGGASVEEGRRLLTAAGIAAYELPERAVRAFDYMLSYSMRRQTRNDAPVAQIQNLSGIDRQAALALIAQFSPGPGGVLSESDSKALLLAYGIETTIPKLALTQADAVRLCREIGYPVVMKLQSPDITHKTEVKGVQLGLADEHAVRDAYDRIVNSVRARRPDARVDGVTVQPMAYSPTGVELIAGAKRDLVFGPVVLVGAGGVLAELLGDQALELAPLDERLARRMLQSLRAWALLSGFRGRPAVDVDGVIDALLRVSRLIIDQPQVLELDVNPLLTTPERVVALDARVILAKVTTSISTEPAIASMRSVGEARNAWSIPRYGPPIAPACQPLSRSREP